jgi:hypothetical protein
MCVGRLLLVIAATAALAGCGGIGEVRFDQDSCYIDGTPAGLPRVEQREALVQRRIAHRQPWLVAITVVVVALAGASYIEKLILLFSASRDAQGMGDRLRALIDRYRAHRVRYVGLIAGSVSLLLLAGTLYIYLDADKRASERALAALQFCHLALRTGDEKRALDEQRRNLSSIRDTAGEIRSLMAMLPPSEQAKAQTIIGHMDDAVGREGRLISEHLQRSEDAAAAISDRTQSIARGVTGLLADVGGLKELPVSVQTLGESLRRLEGRTAGNEEALATVGGHLTNLEHAVDALAARPVPACPACNCAAPPITATATAAASATKTAVAPAVASAPAAPLAAATAPSAAVNTDVAPRPPPSDRSTEKKERTKGD